MHAEPDRRRRPVSGQIYLQQRAKGRVWYMRVRKRLRLRAGRQRRADVRDVSERGTKEQRRRDRADERAAHR